MHAIASDKIADAHRLVARDRADPVAELPDQPPADDGDEPERHLDEDLSARLNTLLATLRRSVRDLGRLADVGSAFGADAQAVEALEPGEGAFDRPADSAQT
ncbi:hypothetical protein [Amycolatopsis dongchuanensis]|uniref:Uncharacterized protein n=1 Tax=Amycolatopsis dongchuanensis TaxID=1070866 RepID=A0ABP9PXQ6_9PSEU